MQVLESRRIAFGTGAINDTSTDVPLAVDPKAKTSSESSGTEEVGEV